MRKLILDYSYMYVCMYVYLCSRSGSGPRLHLAVSTAASFAESSIASRYMNSSAGSSILCVLTHWTTAIARRPSLSLAQGKGKRGAGRIGHAMPASPVLAL